LAQIGRRVRPSAGRWPLTWHPVCEDSHSRCLTVRTHSLTALENSHCGRILTSALGWIRRAVNSRCSSEPPSEIDLAPGRQPPLALTRRQNRAKLRGISATLAHTVSAPRTGRRTSTMSSGWLPIPDSRLFAI
jgi:hypothetical protein